MAVIPSAPPTKQAVILNTSPQPERLSSGANGAPNVFFKGSPKERFVLFGAERGGGESKDLRFSSIHLAVPYDFNVWNPEKATEKLRYIHRNPVTRRLVANLEDWPWSSFRHYATGIESTVEIESFWTVAKRGNQLPEFI